MRNFLALLGWSPGGDREILPEDEMIRLFTLEGIQKKAAVFDTAKLEWMNGQYLSALPAEELLPSRFDAQLDRIGVADRGATSRRSSTRSRPAPEPSSRWPSRSPCGSIPSRASSMPRARR